MNNTKEKLPLSMRILRGAVIINGFILVISFVLSIFAYAFWKKNGMELDFPYVEISYVLFGIIYSVLTVIAINRPKPSTFKVLISVGIVDLVVSFVLLFTKQQSLVDSILGAVLSVCFLLYFLKFKKYFITGSIDVNDAKTKKIDKFFIKFFILIILLFAGVVLNGIINGVKKGLEESTQKYSDMTEFLTYFKGKTTQEGVDYCKTFTSSQKDSCLLYLIPLANSGTSTAILKNATPLGANTCSLVDGESKKVTCYAITNRCDLISDSKSVRLCQTLSVKWQEKKIQK
jgi:hypothetical protein